MLHTQCKIPYASASKKRVLSPLPDRGRAVGPGEEGDRAERVCHDRDRDAMLATIENAVQIAEKIFGPKFVGTH